MQVPTLTSLGLPSVFLLPGSLPVTVLDWPLASSLPLSNSATPFDATWDYLEVISAAPVVRVPIDDIEVLQGASDDIIDLDNHFDDDNGTANLTYSVQANDGTYVTANISANELTLSYPSSDNDVANIIVRATDGAGYFAEDTFIVNVVDPLIVMYRVNAAGDELNSFDPPNPDWDGDGNGGYASDYRNDGSNISAANAQFFDASVPAYVPAAVWEKERWDTGGDPNMIWSFPAPKAGNL